MKNNKNEELQSRRQFSQPSELMVDKEMMDRRSFFRKSASTMLPIAAAIVLPSVLTSCDLDEPDGGGGGGSSSGCSGCSYTCKTSCGDTCRANMAYAPASCKSGCKGACLTACKTGCYGGCKYGSR